MMQRNDTVQSAPIISDEMVREVLRKEIDRAYVGKLTSRAKLAEDSGVNVYQIDQIMSRQPEKQRRVAMGDALSIAWALGEHAANALIAMIGYAARPLEDGEEMQPMLMAATALSDLSIITTAAADGRIDHTEMPACREAADHIIATLIPLSSAGSSHN